MKKSLILAASLAAIVLWGGVLAGCSDDSSSGSSSYYIPSTADSQTAADSLPAPVGTDPFKTGLYKSVSTPKNDDEEPYTEYFRVDTDNRTMTFYEDENEEEEEGDVIVKYTYNEGNHTITMALYKIAIDTGFVGKEGYENYMDDLLKEVNAAIKNPKDYDLEKLKEFRDDIIEAKAENVKLFAEPYIYSYTVSADGNTVTFEDDEEKSVATFLHE